MSQSRVEELMKIVSANLSRTEPPDQEINLGDYTVVSVNATLRDFEEWAMSEDRAGGGALRGMVDLPSPEVFQWISRLRVAQGVDALKKFDEE